MLIHNQHYRTVWYDRQSNVVSLIDQRKLPFQLEILHCKDYRETAAAIAHMAVRGAGAIGATAGFAMAQAFVSLKDEGAITKARLLIEATRPTAVNLFHATQKVYMAGLESVQQAGKAAQDWADADARMCQSIGEYGNTLLPDDARVLTHCNAGWLAFVDYGSALSPVYTAKQAGKSPFVYVDETRPRGQGARLTAYELFHNGIAHKIIADNAAAFYMARGEVDLVITGADRIAANGDVANKIGTLEKAILAKEFGLPFYVAAPFSTFDFNADSGASIPIEERADEELLYHEGPDEEGVMRKIRMAAPGCRGLNPAFDVTSSQYITAFITDRGIFKPSELHALKTDTAAEG
ncbi:MULTISPECIES: S-methyl-5-thioribose-1-phosphate isomerase [unclassified Carboxylicivirga]|uniref:S-methyl-5-thioribose-1-phosphate isomerase n=1 Tax=Carboxylicivirga TaxID=1628153 RepID=UPI003D34C891